MNQHNFSARDLICMSSLNGKSKIYGIPDSFASISGEELQKAVQDGYTSLLDGGIAEMDFDGNITLRQEYEEMISFCCECDHCLTINLQKADGTRQDYIFWRKAKQFWQAEVSDGRYIVSCADAPYIAAVLNSVTVRSASEKRDLKSEIPQIMLTKAKRAAVSGKKSDCLRLLKQNGAEETVAQVIADGLETKADYLAVLLMDNSSGECRKQEYAWLSSRGLVLSLWQSVANLRSCTMFTSVTAESVNTQMVRITEAFLTGEAL